MSDRPLALWLKILGTLLLVFLLLPVIVVVLASFTSTAYLTIPPRGFTLRWFAEVFSDPDYVSAIWLSIKLAIASTLIATVLALPACYALHQRWVPCAVLIGNLMMSPLIFPAIVIGVAMLQYVSILDLRGNFGILVLAHSVIVTPYIVRTALAGFSGLDPFLEEAALVLGANRFLAFVHVVAPAIRSSLSAGLVFALITSFDEVPVTIFLLPPGTATLPVSIFTAIDQGSDPSVAAVSTLLIVITALLLIVLERFAGTRRLM
ncbi:ABC transporter permease [Acidisoma cellulosilytica]|uniref:ABC transporter permease n=2 Tax=Acidisoma cellulosilyticum TaxID=2802395 RepID=A0A963Z552_9PROT|nr:ABC transporter permease [Acidisoma cellulosilyticum]